MAVPYGIPFSLPLSPRGILSREFMEQDDENYPSFFTTWQTGFVR